MHLIVLHSDVKLYVNKKHKILYSSLSESDGEWSYLEDLYNLNFKFRVNFIDGPQVKIEKYVTERIYSYTIKNKEVLIGTSFNAVDPEFKIKDLSHKEVGKNKVYGFSCKHTFELQTKIGGKNFRLESLFYDV